MTKATLVLKLYLLLWWVGPNKSFTYFYFGVVLNGCILLNIMGYFPFFIYYLFTIYLLYLLGWARIGFVVFFFSLIDVFASTAIGLPDNLALSAGLIF